MIVVGAFREGVLVVFAVKDEFATYFFPFDYHISHHLGHEAGGTFFMVMS